jgi:hypothetical protein
MNKPQFIHDCNNCTFLGADQEHDFYYCGKTIPTVIARFGSDGADYVSGLHQALQLENDKSYFDYPLVKALKLARKKNLIPTPTH